MTKNFYVPVLLISVAIVLMLLKAIFLPAEIGSGHPQGITVTLAKIPIYALVLFLGMGLCSLFDYPFTPTHWSLLQLLAVALSYEALAGVLGYVTGDSIAGIISIVIFLVLIGYFFNDEPVNALIAVFLIFTTRVVVALLLKIIFDLILV